MEQLAQLHPAFRTQTPSKRAPVLVLQLYDTASLRDYGHLNLIPPSQDIREVRRNPIKFHHLCLNSSRLLYSVYQKSGDAFIS